MPLRSSTIMASNVFRVPTDQMSRQAVTNNIILQTCICAKVIYQLALSVSLYDNQSKKISTRCDLYGH